MSTVSKIALLKEMIDSAESNLRSAQQIIKEIAKSPSPNSNYNEMATTLPSVSSTDQGRVIEGVFNGQNMIGSDKKAYPVPANYASKSKLIPGDVLKLTIGDDGAFVYKQIGPIERRRVIGPLTYEDGQYQVLAESKAYKVLLASVTYFRAEVGDQITLLVPEYEDSEWGAIENALPKDEIASDDLFSLLETKEKEKTSKPKSSSKKTKTTAKKKKK